tara:strand:+ start:4136 stop:5917 length:1782 start_codon:yes stop_codon:yes gene_type:complete
MTQQEIIERAIAEGRSEYLVLNRYDETIDHIAYPCWDLRRGEYKVSYEKIGTHKPLLELLDDFNRLYNCSLSITNTFRFSPGYIEKIRNVMAESMFPRFNMKSTRLPLRLEQTRHKYANMSDKLRVIDVMLYEMRRQGKTLSNAKNDSVEIYIDFCEKFINSGAYEYFDDIFITDKGPGVDQRVYSHHATRHSPSDPFLCMIKDINDFNIIAKNRDGIIADIPWGSITLVFEMDLYEWVNNYECLTPRAPNGGRFVFNCNALQYPYYKGVDHPFILSDRRGSDRFYGPGNVCFGDLDAEIRMNLHQMDWEMLSIVLNGWVSSFDLGNTSPLNNFNRCKVGILSSYTDNLTNPDLGRDHLVNNAYVDESICRNVHTRDLNDGVEWTNNSFRETFCNNCNYKSSCNYYEETLDVLNEYLLEHLIAYLAEELPWFQDEILMDYDVGHRGDITLNTIVFGQRMTHFMRLFKSGSELANNGQYAYSLPESVLGQFHLYYKLYSVKSKRSGYSNSNDDKDSYPIVSLNVFINELGLYDMSSSRLKEWIGREGGYIKERRRQEAAIEAATNQPDVWVNDEEPSIEDFHESLRDIARRDNL